MTFGFALPCGRHLVVLKLSYICMSNTRVSFRRVFLDMRKKFELFQKTGGGGQNVDAVIDPCWDIDSRQKGSAASLDGVIGPF